MPKQTAGPAVTVFTIGHSNRTIEEFIEMIEVHGIRLVADVRTVPRSRHNPQYNREVMAPALLRLGIDYKHLPGRGGLRHAKKESVNTAWENESFRGFADYMQTDDFSRSLTELIGMVEQRPTAIMCAEAVPWRCHRSLIGDALLARGVAVIDIMSKTSATEHKLTSFAEVNGNMITYPKK
jgi:uncharacterized protein (DUF488 family)